METTPWIYAALLGLGLAASSGLNTFLPLLLLAGVVRFAPLGFDLSLNSNFAWLTSDVALGTLLLATAVEVAGDKIPAVDHFLDVVGTATRPVAGTLAAASVFQNTDPAVATLLGLIIGAPTALGFHAVKAGTRATSSVSTLGMGNPILSLIEDVMAVFMTIISLLVPILVPVVLLLEFWLIWKFYRKVRGRLPFRRAAQGSL